jgi:hypothetical protein
MRQRNSLKIADRKDCAAKVLTKKKLGKHKRLTY